jgi:hypothetical protein
MPFKSKLDDFNRIGLALLITCGLLGVGIIGVLILEDTLSQRFNKKPQNITLVNDPSELVSTNTNKQEDLEIKNMVQLSGTGIIRAMLVDPKTGKDRLYSSRHSKEPLAEALNYLFIDTNTGDSWELLPSNQPIKLLVDFTGNSTAYGSPTSRYQPSSEKILSSLYVIANGEARTNHKQTLFISQNIASKNNAHSPTSPTMLVEDAQEIRDTFELEDFKAITFYTKDNILHMLKYNVTNGEIIENKKISLVK